MTFTWFELSPIAWYALVAGVMLAYSIASLLSRRVVARFFPEGNGSYWRCHLCGSYNANSRDRCGTCRRGKP